MEPTTIPIFHLKRVDGKLQVVNSRFSVQENGCGVWAMWASLEGKRVLLEVGQSANVISEILEDVNMLVDSSKRNKTYRKKAYTARRMFPDSFSVSFTVDTTDKNRTAAKYRIISEQYDDIKVYILNEKDASNFVREVREKFEYEYAIDNRALFWNAWGPQRKRANQYYRDSRMCFI